LRTTIRLERAGFWDHNSDHR